MSEPRCSSSSWVRLVLLAAASELLAQNNDASPSAEDLSDDNPALVLGNHRVPVSEHHFSIDTLFLTE
eukprot:TRINITY_DN158_c0_g1_i1.p1 TRINITY_DN158_c0_g1~~TRINITY_DN158_c0_g1_i1.p1  ORF type:complete len:68 (-),score=14.96 TRINITY_DN158_c0_g1_i1:31-234(-)